MCYTCLCVTRVCVTRVCVLHAFMCYTCVCVCYTYFCVYTCLCVTRVCVLHVFMCYTCLCYTCLCVTRVCVLHVFVCYTCLCITRVLKFYFIQLFSKTLDLEWEEGGSYRILNSALTQRVVQPSCLAAFVVAHARHVCDPSFPTDAASDTVAVKLPRKNGETIWLLAAAMLPASEPPASVALWGSELLHSRWYKRYVSAGGKNDVPSGLGCR